MRAIFQGEGKGMRRMAGHSRACQMQSASSYVQNNTRRPGRGPVGGRAARVDDIAPHTRGRGYLWRRCRALAPSDGDAGGAVDRSGRDVDGGRSDRRAMGANQPLGDGSDAIVLNPADPAAGDAVVAGRDVREARPRGKFASVDEDDEEFEFSFPRSLEDASDQWGSMPSRFRIIFGTCCAFVLCNMDKVNISVAIIPMASDMGWSVSTAGVLQSAFFYGFALSQLPGGYLATRFGGARMLPIGVFLWSAATAAVPFVAGDTTSLFISRVLVGLGEGISPSAATDVIARSVPLKERSRAVAFVFNGFNIGSVLGLSLSPLIIETFGWRTVFVIFGAVGLVWVQWVGLGIYTRGGAAPGTPADAVGSTAAVKGLMGRRKMLPVSTTDSDVSDGNGDDGVSSKETKFDAPATNGTEGEAEEEEPPVPWGEIFQSTPLRALAYVHFCNNWGFYVLLAWLPSYFTQELEVNLTNASLFTLLPPLANIVVASFVGPLADSAIEKGYKVSVVRKSAQSIAFLGPASFMAAACVADNPVATVGLLTVGLSLASFSYAGLYCNHQDMSPRYASILLGMTNTVGAFPGVIGVPLTGYLLEKTDNWELSMFAPAVFFYFTGAAVFGKWGSADRQPWG